MGDTGVTLENAGGFPTAGADFLQRHERWEGPVLFDVGRLLHEEFLTVYRAAAADYEAALFMAMLSVDPMIEPLLKRRARIRCCSAM